MITLFDKYIIKLFLKYTIVVQFFIGVISLLASTALHTKMVDKFNASFINIMVFDILKIPYLLYSTMPMSIVVSTMMVMIILIKNNELIAYVSLGGKVRNLIRPFLAGGLVVAVFLIFMANTLNPKIMYFRAQYSAKHIYKKADLDIRPNLIDIWLKMHGNNFIHILNVDPVKMEFDYVTEYHMNKDLQVESIETYNSAKPHGKQWRIFNQKKYIMSPIPKKVSENRNMITNKPVFDELSKMPFLKPQYVSISDIFKVADIMNKQSINTDKYYSQIYKIFAHAASVIVIIMTIFPLCINFNRNHSYIKVAAKSISVGFGYWMLMASCLSLGKTGVLTPFLSNFVPILIYAALAAFLIYRREHAK